MGNGYSFRRITERDTSHTFGVSLNQKAAKNSNILIEHSTTVIERNCNLIQNSQAVK